MEKQRNWVRFVPTESGVHGLPDANGRRESHIGLKGMKLDDPTIRSEVTRELKRRAK